MRSRNASRILLISVLALAMAVPFLTSTSSVSADANTGSIFTTDVSCGGVNINIFGSKDDVYLNGGPSSPNAPGLPDGFYYVMVTDPSGGTVLGNSVTASAHVTGGVFDQCYQLSNILYTASSGFTVLGYDDTPNNGNEYKVSVSKDSSFPSNATKTDNFKVIPCTDCGHIPQGTINVIKFYDANANGINDDGQLIVGWRIRIQDSVDYIRFTPVSIIVDPDDYVITESDPVETSWHHTTPNPVNITLHDGDNPTIVFGNLCLGPGGGLTLGFWSNKNGQATMNDGGTLCPELSLLNALCLRNATGGDADFACNYTAFRNFLLGANATNMANMLSAQLAAMELNVEAGFVNPGSLIYAPGAASANALGYATVGAVMAEAAAELCAHGYTPAGNAFRSYQESLKNALDKANNNLNFVQATPCPFSFAPLQ